MDRFRGFIFKIKTEDEKKNIQAHDIYLTHDQDHKKECAHI